MSETRQTNWPVVAIAVFAGVVASMQIGKVPPTLGLLRQEFDLGLVAAGWTASMISATAATFGILIGGIADRLGSRKSIVICLGLISLGALMGGLATSGAMLLISRFIESVGLVGVGVSVPGILIRAAKPADQRLAFGYWGTYMPLGMTLMIASAPWLASLVDWRGIWFFNALLAWMFALVFLSLTKNISAPETNAAKISLRSSVAEVLRRPGPWLLGLCFGAYAFQWLGLMAWLPSYLVEQQQLDISIAALATAVVVGANIPGNLLGGWLLHRGVPRWLLPASASIIMGLCGLFIFRAEIPDEARIVLALAFSFVGGLLPPTMLSGTALHSPSTDHLATTNGVVINFANIGTLLGPPGIGAFVALTGDWQATGTLMALVAGAGLLISLVLRVVERRL